MTPEIVSCCCICADASISAEGASYTAELKICTNTKAFDPVAMIYLGQSQGKIPNICSGWPGLVVPGFDEQATSITRRANDNSTLDSIKVGKPLRRGDKGLFCYKLELTYSPTDALGKTKCDNSCNPQDFCAKVNFSTVSSERQLYSAYFAGWWEDTADICIKQCFCPTPNLQEVIKRPYSAFDPVTGTPTLDMAATPCFTMAKDSCNVVTNSVGEPLIDDPLTKTEYHDKIDLTIYYRMDQVNLDLASCIKGSVNRYHMVIKDPCISGEDEGVSPKILSWLCAGTAKVTECSINSQRKDCTQYDPNTGQVVSEELNYWEANIGIERKKCGWCVDKPNLARHSVICKGWPDGHQGTFGNATEDSRIRFRNHWLTPFIGPTGGEIDSPMMIDPSTGRPSYNSQFYMRWCPDPNINWPFLPSASIADLNQYIFENSCWINEWSNQENIFFGCPTGTVGQGLNPQGGGFFPNC